jgi:hypothetical protein
MTGGQKEVVKVPEESTYTIASVPSTFRWLRPPAAKDVTARLVSVTAGPNTDWFIDPGSGKVTMNAPALAAELEGDFMLSARVEADLASTFDAGALVLWKGERVWAKLAYELSPDRQPMVVSVVTRGESDDCNSMPVAGGATWLRISGIGRAYAFHASVDGSRWQLVRHFCLGDAPGVEVGFEAQSPLGQGCSARFSDVRYLATALADLRNGA